MPIVFVISEGDTAEKALNEIDHARIEKIAERILPHTIGKKVGVVSGEFIPTMQSAVAFAEKFQCKFVTIGEIVDREDQSYRIEDLLSMNGY